MGDGIGREGWDAVWDAAEARLARLFGAVDEGESAEVVELRPVEDESEDADG
jgi:hypothetical protein